MGCSVVASNSSLQSHVKPSTRPLSWNKGKEIQIIYGTKSVKKRPKVLKKRSKNEMGCSVVASNSSLQSYVKPSTRPLSWNKAKEVQIIYSTKSVKKRPKLIKKRPQFGLQTNFPKLFWLCH